MDTEKIIDFIQRYAPHYTDKDKLREYILKHIEYKTFFVMKDGDTIVGVCRWNINDDIAYGRDLGTDGSTGANGVSGTITWIYVPPGAGYSFIL